MTKLPPTAMKLLPLAVALIYSPALLAQAKDDPQVVEVTAQKRKENIKDVPLSITAISGAALEDRGIEGPSALTGVVPNLNMAQAPVSGLIASVAIRGIASGQPSIWADPSVGLYVDGVFVGKNQGALFDVADIARVEALRGPQGTLFGRNTEAGAINFVTRKPSGVFGGAVSVEVGNYSRQVERVSVDLPKFGPVSLSVAGRNEKQKGFIDNPNGDAWGGKDRQAGRLAVRVEPTSALTIDYAYDKTKIDETPSGGSLISATGYGSLYPLTTQIGGTTFAFQNPSCLSRNAAGTCVFPSPGIGPAIKPFETPDYPTSISGSTAFGPQYQKLDLDGHTLSIEYKLNANNTLKYIGARRTMTYGDHADYDGTPVLVFEGIRDTDYTTESHELQWIGSNGSGLRWVGGLYFYKDDGTSLNKQAGGLLNFHPQVPGYQTSNFTVTSKAEAVYGQVDFDAGPWGIGVGGRYTRETKGVHAWRYKTNSTWVQQGANTVDQTAEDTFSQFTPTLNLIYRLNKDTNLFGRIAKGFKSGGFPAEAPVTATSAPSTPYKPEVSTSFELGIKTAVLNGRGQVSANVFLTDVKDYQISLLPAGSINPTIVNAGKLRTQGLELDAALSPMDGTRLNIGYGYLEAKFKQYNALSATNVPVDSADNTVVSGAPKHTLSLGLDQRLARLDSGMTLRGLVDYRYVAERYTYPGQISATAANATVGNSAAESLNPALGLLDLRLIASGIKVGGPGDLEVAFFVKNATNERKKVAHMDISGFYQVAFWSDPRTFGATVNYKW